MHLTWAWPAVAPVVDRDAFVLLAGEHFHHALGRVSIAVAATHRVLLACTLHQRTLAHRAALDLHAHLQRVRAPRGVTHVYWALWETKRVQLAFTPGVFNARLKRVQDGPLHEKRAKNGRTSWKRNARSQPSRYGAFKNARTLWNARVLGLLVSETRVWSSLITVFNTFVK